MTPMRRKCPIGVIFHKELFSYYGLFGFLFLTYFTQVFGSIQTVEEQDAIQVVDFVLHDTCKPPFASDLDGLAPWVLPLYNHLFRPTDIISHVAWNAQASLCPKDFSLGLDNFRIEN